jgi:hypothetical protein
VLSWISYPHLHMVHLEAARQALKLLLLLQLLL